MVDTAGSNIPPDGTLESSLDKLVTALPEIYQPIFDHPELSIHVSRKCEDRLVHIAQIYQSLEAKLERPLRVLDLGCAQGFFSLGLAKLGATVYGVDFLDVNIAVCNALAAENSELKVTFQTGHIEEIIVRLAQNQYDLVLGLSVFHHIVHGHGIGLVQKMLSILANKTTAGLFEMALAGEPPDWALSQPQNPRQLLNGYAFVHEFAQNGTHLSAISRPLYIASNRYWFLNGRAEPFDAWKIEPHALANDAKCGTRRYFFGNGLVAKLFMLDNPGCRNVNLQEHDNEVAFLQDPPSDFKAPKLLLHGLHERESWLAREQLPGELLLDKIRFGKPYGAQLVLQDILEQLVSLEAAGLYHDDLRTWNILVGPDGHATLIDYGAIAKNTKDCVWPHNVFLSFMIFVHEIITRDVANPFPFRSPSLNPDGFPEPYCSIFWELLKSNPKEWHFVRLRDKFLQAQSDRLDLSTAPQDGMALALQAMGEACKTYHDTIQLAYCAVRSEQRTQKLKDLRHQGDTEQKELAGLGFQTLGTNKPAF